MSEAKLQGASIAYDNARLPIKRVVVDEVAATGSVDLIAGVAGYLIRVVSGQLTFGITDVYFLEEDGDPVMNGPNAPIEFREGRIEANAWQQNPFGWMQTTTAGKGLQVNRSLSVPVGGSLQYVLVPEPIPLV
jgi:hypothetical protein